MGETVAITGSRGLIGKYIVESLLAKGYYVKVLSRQKEVDLNSSMLTKVIGSLHDSAALNELLEGVDAIYHCAAELHDETKMYDVNVGGTSNMLKAIQKSKTIKYFCYLSSVGVVGPTNQAIVDERSICQPNNEYERTKYEAELLILNSQLNGVKTCVLRPANVFDVNKAGLLSYALNNSVINKLSVFLKGNEGAHLVHAKDVAAAAIFFMDKKLVKPEVFFLSYDNDERNTVLGVYKLCCAQRIGRKFKVLWSLPNFIPYVIRKLRKGVSLHGQTRFSGKKLADAGFVFPMGLEASIVDVCCRYKADKS